MGKGDHIVIPKSILKRFCGEDKRLSCLDIKTKKTSKIYPDSVFVEKYYYNISLDKYIKDNVETDIGILYNMISNNKDELFTIDKS